MRMGLGLGIGGPQAGGGSGSAPYNIPNYFTTTSLFPYAVIDNGNGTFGSTFAAATFKDSGGPFYISPSGDDTTGIGSSLLPWKTISKALTTAATGSLINMAAGRYAPPATTDGVGKLMSFTAATLGTVFVGNLLANADVSSWGTSASGRQQITLSSGTILGFVDTTTTDATTTVNQVSFNASSAANIATLQTAGNAGIYRPSYFSGTTASTLGASDSRDLTNTFDTTLMAWRVGAPTTYFAGGTNTKFYFENIVFVGEQLVKPASAVGNKIIINNCNYVGCDQPIVSAISFTTVIILRNMIISACKGSGSPASDMVDVNTITVLENVKAYNGSAGTGDQAMTAHSGPQMLINCDLRTCASSATGGLGRQGHFGNLYAGTVDSLRAGAILFSIDTHVKGCTFSGTPSSADVTMNTLANNVAVYTYDNSLAGKTIAGGVLTSRSVKPTTQQTLMLIDPSNLATMFQDTAGTNPVTTAGQTVNRINCAAGTGGYIVRDNTGTCTYGTDGTYSWIVNTTTRWVFNSATPFAEDTSIIFGINSTDTVFNLMGLDSTHFIDFRSTGNPFATNCTPYPVTANGGFAVNAGTPSSLATIKSTACNGSNNVFTMRRADLMYTPWRSAGVLCGSTAGANSLDGKFYGLRVVTLGTDAEIKAAEQAMGLKMGTVIP